MKNTTIRKDPTALKAKQITFNAIVNATKQKVIVYKDSFGNFTDIENTTGGVQPIAITYSIDEIEIISETGKENIPSTENKEVKNMTLEAQKKIDEIISSTEEKRKLIISEAEKQANEIITTAKKDATNLLLDTTEKAEELLKAARETRDKIIYEAREKAGLTPENN